MTIIRLQGSLNVESIPSIPPGEDVTLDLSDVAWTYPSGLVALACASRDAASLNVRWPNGADQRRYLSRMHLDSLLRETHPEVSPLSQVHHRQAELCELTFFADELGVGKLSDLVRDHADKARIRTEWAWALEEGTWEICINAVIHSEWTGGFLAAQHYGLRQEIEYAVGDAGIGIRASLLGEYPNIHDDVAAIVKAREYGATRFGQDQQGAGLSETIEQVTRLGGKVVIRSGTGLVAFERDRRTHRFTDDPWRGTLVKVVLPLEQR